MTKAFSKGRPIEPLGVTAEERAYLERQVRRHRVSRSLSERCRIILRCAEGLQSKVVATELYGRQVASALLGRSYRRATRRSSPRQAAHDR
jgi:hypothetical protein